MARTKKTPAKTVQLAPKQARRKQLDTKSASSRGRAQPPTGGVKKPHRYRPGFDCLIGQISTRYPISGPLFDFWPKLLREKYIIRDLGIIR